MGYRPPLPPRRYWEPVRIVIEDDGQGAREIERTPARETTTEALAPVEVHRLPGRPSIQFLTVRPARWKRRWRVFLYRLRIARWARRWRIRRQIEEAEANRAARARALAAATETAWAEWTPPPAGYAEGESPVQKLTD